MSYICVICIAINYIQCTPNLFVICTAIDKSSAREIRVGQSSEGDVQPLFYTPTTK